MDGGLVCGLWGICVWAGQLVAEATSPEWGAISLIREWVTLTLAIIERLCLHGRKTFFDDALVTSGDAQL